MKTFTYERATSDVVAAPNGRLERIDDGAEHLLDLPDALDQRRLTGEHGYFDTRVVFVAESGDDELPDGAGVVGQGGGFVDDAGSLVFAVAVQAHGFPGGGGQLLDVLVEGG